MLAVVAWCGACKSVSAWRTKQHMQRMALVCWSTVSKQGRTVLVFCLCGRNRENTGRRFCWLVLCCGGRSVALAGRGSAEERTTDSNRAYAAVTAPFFRCPLWVPVTSRCGVYGAGCLGKDGHAGAVGRVDGAYHLPHRALAAEAPVRAHAVPPAGPQILRAAGKFTVIESERTAPPRVIVVTRCCLSRPANQSAFSLKPCQHVGGMGERCRFGA